MYALIKNSGTSYPVQANRMMNRMSDVLQNYTKQAKQNYPRLVDDTRGFLSRNIAPVHEAVTSISSEDIREYAAAVGHGLRKGKAYAVIGGIGYIVYKVTEYCRREHTVRRTKTYIKHKPMQSALIALGVGLVLGRVF